MANRAPNQSGPSAKKHATHVRRRKGRSPVIEPPASPLPPAPGMMETLRLDAEATRAENRKPPGWGHACALFIGSVLLIALALTPALITGRLVSTYAVNTPFGDDWKLVDQLENLHLDYLQWGDLYRPVDGERSPLPQLLHLAAMRLTGGDLRADAWMNLTWISLTSIGVLFLLLRTIGGGIGTALLFLMVNLALFSPAQNLFAMRQAGILLPVTCMVWAHLIASFHCSTVLKFAACAILTSAAAASGAYGLALLVTVPVMACFAVGLPCRVRPWLFASAWMVFAGVILRLYFLDWNPLTPLAAPAAPLMESPPPWENGFVFAFQLLAAPLFEGCSWAGPAVSVALGVLVAALLLGMAAWTLISTIGRQHRLSGVCCAPWLLLGIGGLLGIGLLTIARLSLSPNSPGSAAAGVNLGHGAIPVLAGTLTPFGVLMREWMQRLRPSLLRLLPTLLLLSTLAAVIGLQTQSWLRGQEEVRREHLERLRARVALHLCRAFPPDDPAAFGTSDLNVILARASFLHNAGYLNPLLLPERAWPDRRVSPEPLSVLQARVTPIEEIEPPAYRIFARLPRDAGQLEPAAAVLLASKDPFDATQHRLLATATPDPSDPAIWRVQPPPELPGSIPIEFWAVDGHTLIAHRLEQILSPEGEVLRSAPSPH